jgi:hypothetical protein
MIGAQLAFKLAALLYFASFLASRFSPRPRGLAGLFLVPAVLTNLAAVAIRYWQAWPMLPMYLGPVALPLCVGLLLLCHRPSAEAPVVRSSLLGMTALLALLGVLFPKDFYLPFLKSATPLAHLFLIFGALARACFLFAAAWALASLLTQKRGAGRTSPGLQSALRWTVWGFGLATISMFSGELWSYLGWGTPVVWDEPAIAMAMATWFFYICLLHLHLTGSWSPRGRGIYTALGAVFVVLLGSLPDLGPFRWPL